MLKERLLAYPAMYTLFQKTISMGKKSILPEYIDIKAGDKVLDIGCGPADIVANLPDGIEYYGFDASEAYIARARAKYKDRAGLTFKCALVNEDNISADMVEAFDVVMALNILHHIDDASAKILLRGAVLALKKGGVFFSADGCFIKNQNPIARFLHKHDRGKYVRYFDDQEKLAREVLGDNLELFHRQGLMLLPCDAIIMRYVK